MRSIFILSVVFFCANVCVAQINDNFADGDFTIDPAWTPDSMNHWKDTLNQLRSNSSALNSSFYISTRSSKALLAQWEFFVNLRFNTSGANYVDVYLTSESADLTSTTNSGYFVRIGGTSDEVNLYKISGSTATILINGADGITNTSNNTLRIKVIRDAVNRWTLERDNSGTGNNYILEGSAIENTITTSHFFGIKIQQSTASFFNKHFFDDIYVGEIIVDAEPPVVQSVLVNSATEIALLFNEKLDITSAQNKLNYTVKNIGNPEKVSLQADGKTVLLTFPTTFPDAVSCSLSISGIKDLQGNQMVSIDKDFLFFIPVPAKNKDVIITEFFPDPSPQIGLPDEEFIEIYNRSEHVFDIKDWKLSDGSSVSVFPSKMILPGQYLVIVASSVLPKFSTYRNILGVPNFPTLNNTTDTLTLKSAESILVDSISYDLSWYRDEDKQEGGWTLELIDPNNPCGEQDNWSASEDVEGGTPGKQNSVFADKPDLTGPHLEKIVVVQPDQLLVTFNEKLEPLATSGLFTVTPSAGTVSVSFTDQAMKTIQADLSGSLQTQKLYSLRVDNVRDCNGNGIDAKFNELKFAVPEPADSLDVLLNEVLFNPRPAGFDFIEIYNNSPRFINLKDWQLASVEEDGKLKNAKVISAQDLVIAPESYLVFTEDLSSLETNYPSALKERVVIMTLPPMSDDEGSVTLVSDKGKMIDYFQYSEKFHSELVKDPEGVSLERISFSHATNDPQNWKSANSSAGFATPGYLNSNSRPEAVTTTGKVNIIPQLFSPDSGSPDFTKINYKFDQSGLIANVRIFDQQGHFIKELANNASLNYEGFFKWEGDRDDGSRARMGYYLVWFEVFDLAGSIRTFRERVIVAGN